VTLSKSSRIRQVFSLLSSKGNKRRKCDKTYRDDIKKKLKFEISRDEEGGIIFPLQINTSLKLLNIGTINVNPAYHSEHNLFPVGFKSVRTHSSMFYKGKRSEYTCEILEGKD
jgi:hypothetical protein